MFLLKWRKKTPFSSEFSSFSSRTDPLTVACRHFAMWPCLSNAKVHFSKNMSRKWKFSKVCLLTFSAGVFFVHPFRILGNCLAVEFTWYDSK